LIKFWVIRKLLSDAVIRKLQLLKIIGMTEFSINGRGFSTQLRLNPVHETAWGSMVTEETLYLLDCKAHH